MRAYEAQFPPGLLKPYRWHEMDRGYYLARGILPPSEEGSQERLSYRQKRDASHANPTWYGYYAPLIVMLIAPGIYIFVFMEF